MRKHNLSIILAIVFASTFFILIFLNLDIHSISSIGINGISTSSLVQNNEIKDYYNENEGIPSLVMESSSSNINNDVTQSSTTSLNILDNIINIIMSIQSVHNSGD